MKKKYLLLLPVILFSLFSCNENYNLGLNILPNDDNVNINIIDTVQVNLTTEKAFPMISNNPTNLIIGKYNDPVFGISEASFMTQFRETSYPTWGDSAIYDSVSLILPLAFNDYYYGDNKDTHINLSVYKVTDTINHIYKTDQNPDELTNYELIGQGNAYKKYFFADTTSEPDTLALILPLNYSFGYTMVTNSLDYFENTVSYFHNIFKGIYVKNNSENPGLYRINTNTNKENSHFGLVFYYHFAHTSAKVRQYCVSLSTSCSRFNMFSHDYTNATFNNELSDSTNTSNNEFAYLQSMAGTVVKFSAPGLLNLDSIVINKAILIFKTVQNDNNKPLNEIWLAGLDSINTIIKFQDFYSNSYQGALLEDNEYKFNVTRIIQGYINGVYNSNYFDFYLMDLSGASSFERSIITNKNNSNPPRIVITYSKIK